ncbi:MAG: phage shock protein PspA [Caulobacteraceae bacterium]|nr:phage shock protein PspA [Caulobacteraceae bacterium]
MSIWNKLFALFRGAAHDSAEAVVDANALRILDQEIRDADAAQAKARDDTSALVARRRILETEAKSFRDQVGKYEASARAALAKGDEALAMEVAQRIADLERDATTKEGQVAEMRASEDRLRQIINTTDAKIGSLRREIEVVKVNHSVQRAQAAVVSNSAGAGSSLGSAADSLKRIKERQAIQGEKFNAAQELEDRHTGADLDAKLRQAGILPGQNSASDVLARLKAPAGEPMPQLAAPFLQIESQPEPVPVRREES